MSKISEENGPPPLGDEKRGKRKRKEKTNSPNGYVFSMELNPMELNNLSNDPEDEEADEIYAGRHLFNAQTSFQAPKIDVCMKNHYFSNP